MNLKVLFFLILLTIAAMMSRGQPLEAMPTLAQPAPIPAGPTRSVILSWKYPLPLPYTGIEFEIWTQTNVLIPVPVWEVRNGKTNYYADPPRFGPVWSKVANVTTTPVIIPNVYPNQFFILRATNLFTKTCSEWATNYTTTK